MYRFPAISTAMPLGDRAADVAGIPIVSGLALPPPATVLITAFTVKLRTRPLSLSTK